MNDQLEHDLTEGLRALAGHAPSRPGWDGIQRRVAQRRRDHRRQRAVLASVLVLAAVGGLASLAAPARDRQVVAGPSGEAVAGVRFLADVAGFQAVSVTESTDSSPPGATADDGTLTVLTRPDTGFSGPVLFLRTVPAGVNFGFGERSPRAVSVDVHGRTGFVQSTSSLSRSLGWTLPDGSGVYLVSVRLSQDELIAAARALTVDGGRVTWDPGSLPRQLEIRRATSAGQETSSASAEADYTGPRGKAFTVQITAGSDHQVDTFIADRASAAGTVTEVELGGVPAVLSTYDQDDRRSLIWAVAPGLMAEIDATRLSEAEVVAVAKSVRPARDDEWARLATLHRGPSAADMGNDQAIGELALARCAIREEWLSATARGNRPAQDAAAGKLADLVARLRAQGVQPNGDIFVVVDRLVTAMRAGNLAAVQAEACN